MPFNGFGIPTGRKPDVLGLRKRDPERQGLKVGEVRKKKLSPTVKDLFPEKEVGAHAGILSMEKLMASRERLPFALAKEPVFHVVILSKLPENLKICLASLFLMEPHLDESRVIVVDDGAGAAAQRLYPRIKVVRGAKPFIFSRNVNIGIRAADSDVILLNDDAFLRTPHGFSDMARVMAGSPQIGALGPVFPIDRLPNSWGHVYRENTLLSFSCVYIPKAVLNLVGPLDERFIGYGFDDNDYCIRMVRSGLALGIYDGCAVEHGKRERSTYRMTDGYETLLVENRKRYEEKWGEVPEMTQMTRNPVSPATLVEMPADPASSAPRRIMAKNPQAAKIKISCILTSYNRPTLIRQALRSLEEQTHKNFELLLFDDSSKMDIRTVVREFKLPIHRLVKTNVTPTERKSISRLSVNINQGLAMATGDLVCYLADDDYYFPEWFEAAAQFFFENPEAYVAYGRLYHSTSLEMDFDRKGKMLWPGSVVTEPFEKLDHNQVIHRRLKPVVRWPESFSTVTNPDAHYFTTLSEKYPFYPIDACAAIKRMHTKNLQKTFTDLVSGNAENIRE